MAPCARAAPYPAVVGLVLALAVAWNLQPGMAKERRLTTSSQCRTSLNDMLEDSNWKFMNNSLMRWCKLRLENEMARCCSLADFANGRGEGCSDCEADCQHQHFNDLCNKHFGKACTVLRLPFHAQGADSGQVKVRESFCVPENCNNNADLDALIPWYGTLYVGKLDGWHADYDEATLECPNNVVEILLWVIGIIILVILAVPISIILFKAPKERGRTLISQADMMGEADDQDFSSTMYDTAGTMGGQARLRNSAQGDTAPSGFDDTYDMPEGETTYYAGDGGQPQLQG